MLIVGAGPTGLTLACELARSRVSFRLVEAAAGPQPGSRGKGIQPRTLEIFDDLGIAERVIDHGRLSMPMHTTTPDGRVKVSGVDPVPARPDVPYLASLITPEWRIEEALRARLDELGGPVDFDTALVGLEQSDDGVSATLRSGGETETVRPRWLVGCDGGHSVVRRQSGIAFEGETREEVRMIVADVAVDGLDREAWRLWVGAEGMVSLCPLPSTGLFQYQGSIAPGQDPALELANLQEVLNRRSGRSDLVLHEPEWSSLWRANIRLVDRYREGAVFLAGDAAHIHSPAGGQGMNTGIQDAHNLGWKLAAVAGGMAAPALLDSYGAERRPVAADVLELSNARLAQAVGGRGIPTERTAQTMQLSVGYRGSILARDDRSDTAALRAGDRAPDATGLITLDGPHRLFDLIGGGRFTLLNFGSTFVELAFGPVEVRQLRVVSDPTGPDDVADAAGWLAQAYDPGAQTLVLIRPDGYIGLISDAGDSGAVADYIASL